MLKLVVNTIEMYDESTQEFIPPMTEELLLEHSLASISKWESIFKKPFLTKEEKTPKEISAYIKCMTLNENSIDDLLYECMSKKDRATIIAYIDDPQTATTINQKNKNPSRDIITSEIIYYWMIASTIPFECQYWHLNRLLTLINLHSIKSAPPDKANKVSKQDIMRRNTSLNAQRRAAMNSKG